ncbi:hypothetical protein AAZV13_04G152350 [Glycine max]
MNFIVRFFNNQFLDKVEEKFPKDAELIVACQKGLRSLAACELLYNAGYKNLFWVQGGYEAAEGEDFIVEGPSASQVFWNWWSFRIPWDMVANFRLHNYFQLD